MPHWKIPTQSFRNFSSEERKGNNRQEVKYSNTREIIPSNFIFILVIFCKFSSNTTDLFVAAFWNNSVGGGLACILARQVSHSHQAKR